MIRYRDGVLVWQRDPPRVEAHQSGDPSWTATYRFREDNGDESSTGAPFLAAAGTPITVGPSGDVALDTVLRIRVLIDEQNTGGGGDYGFDMDFRLNGGTWTTSWNSLSDTAVNSTSLSDLTNNDPTTDHGFTAPSGSFTAGLQNEANNSRLDDNTAREIAQNDYIIFEKAIKFNSAQLSDGDEIEFRVQVGGTDDADIFQIGGTDHVVATVATASGTDVAANTATLTLTELTASVSHDITVAAGVDALTLATFAATVELTQDVNVAANTDALTLSTLSATVNAATNVLAGTAALALTEQPATVNAETNVQANAAALTLSAQAATVNAETNVQATTTALTLTGQPATVNAATDVQTATAALTLATFAATVSSTTDTDVAASTAALTLATFGATVNAETNVAAATTALTLTEQAATVSLDTTVAANTASLVLTTNQATVNAATNVAASTAALTLATFAAALSVDRTVAANLATLTLTEQAASVSAFGPPQNLVATPISSSQIDLGWDAVPGATGYDIERDAAVVVLDHGTTSYSDTGLAGGVQYDYRVRALQEVVA